MVSRAARKFWPATGDRFEVRRQALKLRFWDERHLHPPGMLGDLTYETIKGLPGLRIYELRLDDTIGGLSNIRIVFFDPPRNWQRAARNLSLQENEADAGRLHDMLLAVDRCPVPVVARVHGAALGGGMGLCAAADLVLAEAGTRFGFTETKLGILPAVIAPFVLAKIGESQARAVIPPGERFDAERARAMGLVHEVLPDTAALDERVDAAAREILSAGPAAARAAKALIRDLRGTSTNAARKLIVSVAARRRVSAEGQEGLGAFLEKRTPHWPDDPE